MTWAQGFPESISHGTPRVASVVSPVLSGVGNLASQTRDYHSRQKQAPRRLLAGPRVRHERPRLHARYIGEADDIKKYNATYQRYL